MAELVIGAAISAAVSTAVGFGVKALTSVVSSEKRRAAAEIAPAPSKVTPLSVQPNPGGSHPGFFGHGRVGGDVILSASANDVGYLVIEIAGASINGVPGVYINNRLVRIDASGDVKDSPWVDASGNSAINVKIYDGSQTTVDSELDAAFPGWTADHVGKGIVYARIKMNPNVNPTFFANTFSQTPDFTFEVMGFKCYDPRNGSCVLGNPATYVYSDNVSICRANYAIHELGAQFPPALIDWASVASAADIDDEAVALANGGTERRYTCFAYFRTDQRHEDVFEKFNHANGGDFAPIGDKYVSRSGSYGASIYPITITPDDYEADGLRFADCAPLGSRVNGVRGIFTSPLHHYEERDFPAFQDASALADDAAGLGVSSASAEAWLDLELSFVTSPSQAQRLARIAYNRARFGFPASVALQFTHFDAVAGDTVTITDDFAAFSGVTFRVTRDACPNYVCQLDLEHDAASFYAWTTADEKAFDSSEPLTGASAGLFGGALIDTNAAAGNIHANVKIWAGPALPADADHYRFKETTTGISRWTGPLSSTQTANTTNLIGAAALPFYSLVIEDASNNALQTLNFASGVGNASLIDGHTEGTATFFEHPAPKAPRVLSANSGAARLRLFATTSTRADGLDLYENTTNDSGTATLVSSLSHADQTVTVSGASGTVKFYWTRAKSTSPAKTGPFSLAALVVF